jgi:hypothetical protein
VTGISEADEHSGNPAVDENQAPFVVVTRRQYLDGLEADLGSHLPENGGKLRRLQAVPEGWAERSPGYEHWIP